MSKHTGLPLRDGQPAGRPYRWEMARGWMPPLGAPMFAGKDWERRLSSARKMHAEACAPGVVVGTQSCCARGHLRKYARSAGCPREGPIQALMGCNLLSRSAFTAGVSRSLLLLALPSEFSNGSADFFGGREFKDVASKMASVFGVCFSNALFGGKEQRRSN